MRFNETSFVIHDISAFPIVRQRAGAVRPGYAARWEREMDTLVQAATPFVVILQQGYAEEDQADRQSRALWLRRNREPLAAICKVVIGIEHNSLKRAAFKAQALLAAEAFGTKVDIAASDEEAMAMARAILAEHDL